MKAAVRGEIGLAAALIAGETCGAAFALYVLRKSLRKTHI